MIIEIKTMFESRFAEKYARVIDITDMYAKSNFSK